MSGDTDFPPRTEFRPTKVWYLEMPAAVAPADSDPSFRFEPWVPPIDHGRYLASYDLTGRPWHWLDRFFLPEAELTALINAETTCIFSVFHNNIEVGWVELARLSPTETELLYFGLFPQFAGRKLGRAFLAATLRQAFAPGVGKVILNTCDLDHPAALPVYLKSGFTMLRETVENRRFRLIS